MARKKVSNGQKYTVNIALSAWDIAKAGAGIKLAIRDREGVLGTIEIGQGTFGWKGAKGKKFKRIEWSKMAAEFEKY